MPSILIISYFLGVGRLRRTSRARNAIGSRVYGINVQQPCKHARREWERDDVN